MKLEFRLDDQPMKAELDERHQVLDILRNQCNRKDFLSGCSPQGICGSCMVIVRGKPRLSCTLRAKNIHNKDLHSAESISPDLMRRLEEAFIACGASQCAFCMSGILTQVATLLTHFPKPTETQINKALNMHSCRCTGWNPIRKAIDIVSQNSPLPQGELHMAQRKAMWGKRPRVADITLPEMKYALPIFTDQASGTFGGLNIPPNTPQDIEVLCWRNLESPQFLKPKQYFHGCDKLVGILIANSEIEARRWIEQIEILITEKPPPEQQTLFTEEFVIGELDTDSTAHVVELSINEEIRDPGYLEPECVVVDTTNKRVIINGIDPFKVKKLCPQYTVYSWATGGSFGGRTEVNYVSWALLASEHLGCSIKLALSMNESIRIRAKNPPSTINLQLRCNRDGLFLSLVAEIELDGGNKPEYCVPLLKRLCSEIAGPYTIPHIHVKGSIFSKEATIHRPLRDTGSVVRTFALERAIDRLTQQIRLDAISIRHQNIQSIQWKKLLDDLAKPYLADLKMGKAISLACSTQRQGWTGQSTAKACVFIEGSDSVIIYGSIPETGVFHEWNCIERLSKITGISSENIHYECSTVYPVNSTICSMLDRETAVLAVARAGKSLQNAMKKESLTELQGQVFWGEAIHENNAAGFAAVLAILDSEGKVEQLRASTMGGGVDNTELTESLIAGSIHAGLGRETVSMQENGLPSPYYRELNIAKAKNTPAMLIKQYRASKFLPINMTTAATAAAIGNVRSRYQENEINSLPLPDLDRKQ